MRLGTETNRLARVSLINDQEHFEMGNITEALAKAKLQSGQTQAPFLSDAVAKAQAARAKKLRRARRARIFWTILAPLAFIASVCLIWTEIKGKKVESRVPIEPQEVVVITTAKPQIQRNSPKTPIPSPELQEVVNGWVLGAVLPGTSPRIVFKGRILRIGDAMDSELVFTGLEGQEVLFKDTDGSIYRRRY
jgi:hypothetical protein